jgi:hypothetical protein
MPPMPPIKESIHSIWTKLGKYKPEEIGDFIDRVFSKYDQPFKPLSVDDTRRVVKIELKDGRKIEMLI